MGSPDFAAVAREEGVVGDITARRLIPVADLVGWLERRVTTGDSVESWEIAEEFDVPDVVVERALRLLRETS